MKQLKLLQRLCAITLLLAFVVIVLGAWVRLSDAGLGCPDWPGCYGHITWPEQANEIAKAELSFPERPVEIDKAWKEVIHRYFAGTLGLMVLIIAILNWRLRREFSGLPIKPSLLLLPLIVIQALFGMWTVTLKLLPWVVTTHLIGGMLTFSLLYWVNRCVWHDARRIRSDESAFEYQTPQALKTYRSLRTGVTIGLMILFGQIFLGGWTSSNYAALACLDFPTCQQQWWPATNFSEAFTLWREIGVNYEGGLLDQSARNAIHITHRIGALVTAIVLSLCAWQLWRQSSTQRTGLYLGGLLIIQITLGIQNVLLKLPLINAVAHNGVAALLLATLVNALWLSTRHQRTNT